MRRRALSITGVVAAAALGALLAAGCATDDPASPANPLIGTWSLTQVVSGGTTLPAGTSTMTATATFNADQTYQILSVMYMFGPAVADTESGTWSTAGDKLLTTETGATATDTATYSVSGTTLTTSATEMYSGTPTPVTMTFAKQ